jgi:hypothetical protein
MLSDAQIAEIKTRHPLREYIEASIPGTEWETVGGGKFKCRCPFHTEKTSSFMVDSRDHHYHCFGCGVSGDVIKFVRETQGMTFVEATAHLMGVDPTPERFVPVAAPVVVNAKSQRMSATKWQVWEDACERLATTPSQIERIAAWRGFSPEIIVKAAKARLMGLTSYWGETREAFLISAPAHCIVGGEGYDPVPVSLHTRLAAHTRGNGGAKQSWHYDPKSTDEAPVRSWPFLWGNPNNALWLFVLEGQWDAMAVADAVGWTSPADLPVGTAIVGIRGSTGSARFLEDFVFNPKGVAIAINDADKAGDQWHVEGGFLDQLRGRLKEVISYRPAAPQCKDVNDLYKAGYLDSEALLALIRQRLQQQNTPMARPTFTAWCRKRRNLEDELGRAARFVLSDKTKPKKRVSLDAWRSHWRGLSVGEDLMSALDTALQEWITGDYTLTENEQSL